MKTTLADYRDLVRAYLKPQWRKAALLGILLVTVTGVQLILPQITRGFIDGAASGAPVRDLMLLAVAFLGVGFVNQLFNAAATYFSQDVGWTATNSMRCDLAQHCLSLDMPFHNDRTPGEMIERIEGDVNTLAEFFARFIFQVLGSMLMLVGVLVMLFREDWRVGGALAIFAALAMVVLYLGRSIAVPHFRAERAAYARLYGFLEERLAGTEDIRANGAVAYVMRRFFELSRAVYRKAIKAALMGQVVWVAATLLFAAASVISFGLGAHLFLSGGVKIGAVYLIVQYTEMLLRPLERLTRRIQELQRATAAIQRIQEIRQIRPVIEAVAHGALPTGQLAVEFEHVSFAYVEDDLVLDDVNFSLLPGRALGLLGRTGSGKTTISRLLYRLYDPGSGVVRLGGSDIRRLDMAGLRAGIGMVTQDVQLFHASVRDNLTFFDPAYADDHILAVLEELGLIPWYESLDTGLDTVLDSEGSGLSAGEAQLLAFTRVFLKDPGLVILDEASSRLDPLTEQWIERAIDHLLRDRTAIIIAHRLATIQRVDEVMILKEGRVREHGKRVNLAADPQSQFSHLLRTGAEAALS
ncbi:helicase [Candidatus Poribacteria bacterium]|nr:helicase [Candidatus Poribacteria bacterium]